MRKEAIRFFDRLTMTVKIWVLIVLTVALALLLSTAALVQHQINSERASSSRRHEQIARVISANVGAALLFDDREAARESMATIAGIADIAWVRVFLRGRQLYSSYSNDLSDRRVEVVAYPVLVNGSHVGDLRMGVHHPTTMEIARQIAAPTLLSFATSLFIALVFAHRFFRGVYRPIDRQLAEVRKIVSSGNYASRLQDGQGPEFRLISDSFNAMLAEVEARNTALCNQAEELRTARDQAENASLAKSQFLANMSHELRTPLNAIIGYAQVLQEDLTTTGLARSIEDVAWILGSARQLLELIDGILDVSKIEAGRMVVDPHETDLAALMREVAATLGPLAAQRRNTLHVRLDPDLRRAFTDATKLRQCLLNLGSNACKFTEDGHVFLQAYGQGDDIVFCVSDTGIGMSPAELSGLFQPFVQADASTTRLYGGTGLGLTISSRFAELLSGSIEVESTPGQGSTFTLRIPAKLTTQPDGQNPSGLSERSLAA